MHDLHRRQLVRGSLSLGGLTSKNPKWVTTIFVSNTQPHGFWPDRGYNWFSGI